MKIVTTSQFRIAINRQVPDNCNTPSFPLMPTGSSVVCPSLNFLKAWHSEWQNKINRLGLRAGRAQARSNPCGLFSSEAVNYLNHSVAMVGDDYVAAMFQARIDIHSEAGLLGIRGKHCNCVVMTDDEQLFFYEPQNEVFQLMPFGDAMHYCDVYDIIV